MTHFKGLILILLAIIFSLGIPIFILVMAFANLEKTTIFSWLISIIVIIASVYLAEKFYTASRRRY